jgi:hypothetical protein
MASALGDVWAATTGKRLALASGSAYPKTILLLFADGTLSHAIKDKRRQTAAPRDGSLPLPDYEGVDFSCSGP